MTPETKAALDAMEEIDKTIDELLSAIPRTAHDSYGIIAGIGKARTEYVREYIKAALLAKDEVQTVDASFEKFNEQWAKIVINQLEKQDSWKQTVREIYDNLHFSDKTVFNDGLAKVIVGMIEKRHYDYFCCNGLKVTK